MEVGIEMSSNVTRAKMTCERARSNLDLDHGISAWACSTEHRAMQLGPNPLEAKESPGTCCGRPSRKASRASVKTLWLVRLLAHSLCLERSHDRDETHHGKRRRSVEERGMGQSGARWSPMVRRHQIRPGTAPVQEPAGPVWSRLFRRVA